MCCQRLDCIHKTFNGFCRLSRYKSLCHLYAFILPQSVSRPRPAYVKFRCPKFHFLDCRSLCSNFNSCSFSNMEVIAK